MGKRRRLFQQLFTVSFVVLVAAVALMGWYTTSTVSSLLEKHTLVDLATQASLLEALARGRLASGDSEELNSILKAMAIKIPARLTVFSPSGEIVADTLEEAARMEDYRPEVNEALKGKPSRITRPSLTTNEPTIYLAVPVMEDGRVASVARVALPVPTTIWHDIPFFTVLTLEVMLVLALAALSSLYMARGIKRHINELRGAATRFADMDLDHLVDEPDSEEFGTLADDLNSMAIKLKETIEEIREQRNELEAVLAGMVEAVLVIDTRERLLRVNRAAERLFNIREEVVKNRIVHEAIRNTNLHRFTSRTLAGDGPIESDITTIGNPDKYLQAHGTRLMDSKGDTLGAIIVLNDVTRIRTLENIRRDFVSNVSHELKTPITSIKGFLETLKEGAFNDPDNAKRFLDIIIKHTDRLHEIIEDLLSLSRIERDYDRGEISLQEIPIKPILESVVKTCDKKASVKNIAIHLEVSGDIEARINMSLLEQAMINLVENAVKYSEPGSSVHIEAFRDNEKVVIRVADTGCGIPKEHLSRIFERFYRVDKARSRREGGTGLGLSIVKHIVNAHGGEVSVESSPGRGSVFSILLPIA